ncbi:MAG TPA: L,D-transpeptidase family protein [Vicinamibacterales bacterium]|nr:L,D-transpeptidase family protein [Vicinamibacterales bacterium]
MQPFCRSYAATAILIALISASSCARFTSSGSERDAQAQAAVRQIVESTKRPDYVTRDRDGARLWKLVHNFYQHREFAPAWIDDGSPKPQMDALIRAIHTANREGLDPELYSANLLDQRKQESSRGFLTKKGFNPEEATAMDVWLTWLYMKFASDLADGVSDLAHADPAWKIEAKSFDSLAHLERALRDNRIAESLFELTPTSPDYRALQRALEDYRGMADRGGWPTVPANIRLKPGQWSPLAGALARRLAVSGDYSGGAPASGVSIKYDHELEEAVKRFQRRHGLADDGAVGPALAAELNVPVDARIRQIALNMERWRWLPRDLGDPHILVNIPEMRLDVTEHGTTPVTMRVVVGKPDTQTPIFSDKMTYLVFAPVWNVPDDIAEQETLPAALNDPGFLNRMNMEVVDASGNSVNPATMDLSSLAKYRFRQRPGGSNALGLVKFMFPNQFNVYLHDTPTDSLFTRASRSFSHGCVRLEQPEKLAGYVLRDQPEWTSERIQEAMHAGEETIVKLKAAIPVYLGYWTARVTPDRQVQFRKDVYGIDASQSAKLTERLKRMKTSARAAQTAVAPEKPTASGGSSR